MKMVRLSTAPGTSVFGAVLLTLTAGFEALGQGTVTFHNRVAGIAITHVFGPEPGSYPVSKYGNTTSDIPSGTQVYQGYLLTGSHWRAQLWAAPGSNQPESALQAAFPITTFRTGGAAGNIAGVTATLAGVPLDCPVATVQMRVWNDAFATWQEAETYYYSENSWGLGKSLAFNVQFIGGGSNSPPILTNLQSFSLRQSLGYSAVPPIIIGQPENLSVAIGGSASFQARVSCFGTLQYNWLFNGSVMTSGIASGGLYYTNVLTLTNVQTSQAGIYTFIVTNICCPSSSNPNMTAVSSNTVLTVGSPGLLSVRERVPQMVLNWDDVFFLQSAATVAGPYSDLPGPVVFAPYTNSDSSVTKFFRLRN
jgi:hypothetical protein